MKSIPNTRPIATHRRKICGRNSASFARRLPPISPGVAGLYVADTCYYYPEDRSISESIQLGRKLARMAAETE